MRFRGHLIGGVIAGVIVVGIAAKSGVVSIRADSPSSLISVDALSQSDTSTTIMLFLLTLVMALFPDLDTASIPQRWFLRLSYLLLIVLLFLKQMDLFAIVTLILLLPLLHHHRGWTHSKLAPFAIAILVIMVMLYLQSPFLQIERFSIDYAIFLFQEYWIIFLACVVGHYTHLLLDSR
ncbi:MAG: metal-dependent hydrolase [SAR324 cluster bacterium]|nr:metal-dependent hydrolase [SAR324 cluster bacterium]